MQTDLIKLDMRIVRSIETDERTQRTGRSIVGMCRELGTSIIAEEVETQPEFDVLRNAGITQFQGFYLGQPFLEGLRTAPPDPPVCRGLIFKPARQSSGARYVGQRTIAFAPPPAGSPDSGDGCGQNPLYR
jgi:hypothetical protein